MRIYTAAVFAGMVATLGCSTTPEPVAAGPTDSQVEDSIKAQYNADADLRAANIDVDANVSERKVTVSGTVPTEEQRSKVVDIAQKAQPGYSVEAKVDVKPRMIPRAEYTEDMARDARDKAKAAGRTIGSSLDDAWIHTTISTKMAVDGDTPMTGINVDVNNNTVTLRGDVDNETAKAEAERIAKETDGVKSVRNLLKVRP